MYDMSVPDADMRAALAWWRNLSNNQMKTLEKTHFPHRSGTHRHMIHWMWNVEGKPEPQALTPVDPRFLT